jgi:hypothetical protein
VEDKSYRENQNTHFVLSEFYLFLFCYYYYYLLFFLENLAIYEIMWKNKWKTKVIGKIKTHILC